MGRSAVWGGATAGVVIGLIAGIFAGDIGKFAGYGLLIGAVSGVAGNALAWFGLFLKRRVEGPDAREELLNMLRKQGLSREEAEFELTEREREADIIYRSEDIAPQERHERAKQILYSADLRHARRSLEPPGPNPS